MKKHTDLTLPAQYALMNDQDCSNVTGGGSFLSFISYLLGGFNISFGSNNRHSNSDTITSVDGYRTGSGYVVHSNVDNVTSNQYGGWSANFNLGSLFNALARLFR